MEAVERERDFYFGKLTEIEVSEDLNYSSTDVDKVFTNKVLDVLYGTEVIRC